MNKSTTVPVASLTLDVRNVRKHPEPSLAAIKASLLRFGQQKPIVVGPDRVVIAGNGTLEAARALGWETLEVRWSKLTGDEARAYAVADNRTNDLSAFDDAALAELLQSLPELEGTGFTQGSLDELLASLNGHKGLTDPDAVPEPPKQAMTRLGDLWTLGTHRLLCGDATSAEDHARVIGDAHIDLVLTDPPYGVGDFTGGDPVREDGVKWSDLHQEAAA